MKRTFYLAFCLLLCTLLLVVVPVAGEEQIYNDVIRLHILAASNSEEDQSNKLRVRDAILQIYGTSLSGHQDRESACKAAQTLLPQIERTARQTLEAMGSRDTVTVSLTEEVYPRRSYVDFSLPAGTYLSLRILIGEAKGENWWCVLYPPLCTEIACTAPVGEEGGVLSEAEYGLMTENTKGRYTVKFRFLELLERYFT